MGAGLKTFTSGPLSSSDVNNYLMKQTTIPCTSTTRPAAPEVGMRIYETDTDLRKYWDGSRWAFDQTAFFTSGKPGGASTDLTDAGENNLWSTTWVDLPAGQVGWALYVVLSTTAAATQANLRVYAKSGTNAAVGQGDPPADLMTARLPYAIGGVVTHTGGDLTLNAKIILPGAAGTTVANGCRVYQAGSGIVLTGGA